MQRHKAIPSTGILSSLPNESSPISPPSGAHLQPGNQLNHNEAFQSYARQTM